MNPAPVAQETWPDGVLEGATFDPYIMYYSPYPSLSVAPTHSQQYGTRGRGERFLYVLLPIPVGDERCWLQNRILKSEKGGHDYSTLLLGAGGTFTFSWDSKARRT